MQFGTSTVGRETTTTHEAGQWSGERWVITSGLKGGERVITDGVMKIGPGAPVKVAENKPAAKPEPQAAKK